MLSRARVFPLRFICAFLIGLEGLTFISVWLTEVTPVASDLVAAPVGTTLQAEFRALAYSPVHPREVLQFWYGSASYPDHIEVMDQLSYIHNRVPTLMGRQGVNPLFDAECAIFTRLIFLVGSRSMALASEWQEPWGLHAQLLLLDQLSRNVFRGTWRQYAFEDVALELARALAKDPAQHVREFPLAASFFTSVALVHSEHIEDYELAYSLLNEMSQKIGSETPGKVNTPLASGSLQGSYSKYLAHRVIVSRFGRFPYRNAMLGRTSTAEETDWLAGEIPSWARHAQTPFPRHRYPVASQTFDPSVPGTNEVLNT